MKNYLFTSIIKCNDGDEKYIADSINDGMDFNGEEGLIESSVEETNILGGTKLLIILEIQDGERSHTHKVLTSTNCKNLDFAVEWYVAHFWGQGELEKVYTHKRFWWYNDGFAGHLTSYTELTNTEYNILSKFL